MTMMSLACGDAVAGPLLRRKTEHVQLIPQVGWWTGRRQGLDAPEVEVGEWGSQVRRRSEDLGNQKQPNDPSQR